MLWNKSFTTATSVAVICTAGAFLTGFAPIPANVSAAETSESLTLAASKDLAAIGSEDALPERDLEVEGGDEGWYILAPDGSKQKVQPGSASLKAPESGRSPRLLDLWMWTQCWTINDSNFTIKSYDWWWSGQKNQIDLKCGFHDTARGTGSGYKHIAAGHQQDWQNKLDQIGDPRYSWDDVMSSGIYAALMYPEYTTAQSGQKRCAYGILVYLTAKGIQQQFEPTVFWSENNKLIITAIPKTKGSC